MMKVVEFINGPLKGQRRMLDIEGNCYDVPCYDPVRIELGKRADEPVPAEMVVRHVTYEWTGRIGPGHAYEFALRI